MSWTGVLDGRHHATGIKLDWAYAPGEFKVILSSDGSNFAEAGSWQSAGRSEVSFVDHAMLEPPTSILAVTVVMHHPQAWGYFGINDVSLLSEPGPTMLVSGATSSSGPLCVVRGRSHGQLSLAPCSITIARPVGGEVFLFSGAGQLASAAKPSRCITLAGGDAADARQLMMGSCRGGVDARDGRSSLTPTASGQLRFDGTGGYCVSVGGGISSGDAASRANVSITSASLGHRADNAKGEHGQNLKWRLAMNPSSKGPAALTFDFGAPVNVESIEI